MEPIGTLPDRSGPESHRGGRDVMVRSLLDLYTREMANLRIETEGLTLKEVVELEKIIAAFDDVDSTEFTPILPGAMKRRAFVVQATIPVAHILIHLAQTGMTAAVGGTVIAASQHAYKRVGEALVDKAWDAIKGKFSGNSVVEGGIKLYGPDGQLIKQHKGKR
jgi:hypothetical protein